MTSRTSESSGDDNFDALELSVDIISNCFIIVPIILAVWSRRVESGSGHILSLVLGVLWIAFAFLRGKSHVSMVGQIINVIGLMILLYLWYSYDHDNAEYPNSYEIQTDPNSCIAKYAPLQYRGNNVCFVLKNEPTNDN